VTRVRIALSVIAVFACVAGILIALTIVARPREHADLPCRRNLLRLGPTMLRFAREHDGRFPSRLEDLVPYCGRSDIFLAHPTVGYVGAQTNVSAWSDYVLFAGRSLADSGTTVLVRCRTGTHKSGVVHLLLTDGRVVDREATGE
jgi:hypothetical protein